MVHPNFDFKFLTKRTAYTCSTFGIYIHGLHYFILPFHHTSATMSPQQYLSRHFIESLFQIDKCYIQFPVFCEKLSKNRNCIRCALTVAKAKLHFINVNCITCDVCYHSFNNLYNIVG